MGNPYIHCIEEEAYSQDDVFIERRNFKVISFFNDNFSGLIHSTIINSGVISTKAGTTINIQLNPNLSYIILITDPKLHFLFSNPDTIPRTFLRFETNAGGVSLYFKVNIIDIR